MTAWRCCHRSTFRPKARARYSTVCAWPLSRPLPPGSAWLGVGWLTHVAGSSAGSPPRLRHRASAQKPKGIGMTMVKVR